MRRVPHPAGPLVEELESRLLFSADLDGLVPLATAGQHAVPGLSPIAAASGWEQSAQTSQQQGMVSQQTTTRELVILDWRVDNADQWRTAIEAEAARSGRAIEVVVLTADRSGLAQITDLLASREGLTAVHIISHGDAQGLALGSDRLDSTTLLAHAGDVAGWARALHAEADLLLYGCDLAADATGRALLGDLAMLTGADVAASVDRTGAASLGGDWDLEHRIGTVDTALAVGLDFQVSWQQVLPTVTFQEGVSSYSGTQDTHITSAAPGTANGTSATLTLTGATGQQILLRFDNLFSGSGGSIPIGSVIDSATLQLRIVEDGTGLGYLHRILSVNWNESSTWNSVGDGVALDDVEARSTADGSNNLSNNNSFITYTVTASVQSWANGASNLGWMIYTDGNELGLASSENGTLANRPLLTINYTAPTPPALDLNGGAAGTGYTAAYTENTPVAVAAPGAATVTAGVNGVSSNLSGMTVTLTNILDAGQEFLSATTTGTNISASYNSATGVLALSGSDTAAAYQQVLRTIQYNNLSDNPNTTNRTIQFVATDPYGGNSTTASTTVTVTRVNDAPVITSNGGGATAAVSVQETRTLVTTVTATDPEGTAITYSISGGADAARFSITAGGVLSFATAPDFENPTDSNADNVYEVTVRASDGSLFATQTLSVTVTDVSNLLVVDTTSDTNDSGLGSSFTIEQLNASKGTDGKVSLREAIIAANNTAGLDVITFNLTGATGVYGEYTILPTSTLPSITDAVYINAASQPGYAGQPRIVLDGEGGAGNGFTLTNTADGSTIRGFVIRDFGGDGIHIQSGSDNHTIVGNYIGSFHADGSNAGLGERNAASGIQSYGANVTIGGTTAADRNVISGNVSAYNIYLLSGANGTTILGNYIGTNAAGSSAFTTTNGSYGIMIETSSSQITIGGTAAGAGNVIAGFSNHGIWATTTGTVTIQGNRVGTDATGLLDLGNAGYGIYVDDGGTVLIGGTVVGAGNLVSGNNGGGIYVGGSAAVTLQGNIVGLNAAGTSALGNTGVGVYLTSSVVTTVGGSTAGARNIISGNSSHGVAIHSSPAAGHVVRGNYIGVAADGTTPAGNGGAGVYIAASNSVIGGKSDGEGNVIANNGGAGIVVNSGHSNLFYRNSIHSHAGLGIDLDNNGVTFNDFGDGDGGANYRNNFPVITSVVTSGGVTRILGSVEYYHGATLYLEFFASPTPDGSGHGEGRIYLGAVQLTTDATTGDASFSIDVTGVNVGDWITAVSNVETGFVGASEFALAVQAVAPAQAPRGKLIWNNNDQFFQFYADWMGSAFGGTGVNGLSFGDDISMIAAAEAPTRREILFIGAADVSGKILAGIWNGSSWSSVLTIPLADPSDVASQYESFALAYDNATGNAVLVWSNGTSGTAGLSYAVWNGSTWSAIQTITAPVSGEPVHMKLAAHPTRSEMVLAVETSAASNNQYALVWNGSSWGQAQTLGTNSSKQYFELGVVYEQRSGRAMVVYDASAANASEFQYRLWDGSSWSAQATAAAPAGITATSELHTVVLVGDPGSDRLALAAKNAANQLWLHVWDGSVWDAGLVATTSGVTLTDHHPTMALAFESQSGELLAAYGKSAGPNVFFRTWSAATGWSAEQTGPSMGGTDIPYVVKLYADPYSNEIMLVVQDNGADLHTSLWGGGSWGAVSTMDSSTGFTYRENFTFVWYRQAAVIANLDGDARAFVEGGAPIKLDAGGNATVATESADWYDGATLTVEIASGGQAAEDVLGIDSVGQAAGQIAVIGNEVRYGGVTIGTVSGGSAGAPLVVTLNGAATDLAVTALVRSLTYANSNQAAPSTQDRQVRVGLVSAQGQASTPQTITVAVQAVNDPPVITSNGGGASAAISVNENTTAVTTVTATDVDTVTPLVYAIAGGADAARFTIDAVTGVVRFAVAPDFEAPTDANGDNVYEVIVSVSDGQDTDAQTLLVTVLNVNDIPPVITSNGGGASAAVSVNENTTAVTTVTATDTDGIGSVSYSISGGADAAGFTIDAVTGVLTFTVAPNAEAPSDVNGDNVYEVVVRASDGSLSSTQTVFVTVQDVNEFAPVITSNGGGASAAVSIGESTTAVTTVTATDADAVSSLSYSISGGADAALFSIDASTGVLRFIAAPDFEAPQDAGSNNVYDVEVTVSDGSFTDVQAIAVTVNNVNDNAPVITSNGGGASAAVAIDENTTAVTTVTATDADGLGVLTYSITGGADAARFTINSMTGVLEFIVAPDREAPTDAGGNNVYDVEVTVSDGSLTVMQAIAVTVNNVNDNAPVITSNGGGAIGAVSVNEGEVDVTTVMASDADAGSSLSYSISGGADAALFTIDPVTGQLRFVSPPDFITPLDVDQDNVYEVNVAASDGLLSSQQALAITVLDVNGNAPVITSNGGSGAAQVDVNENSIYVTTVTATDADPTDTLTYSISGGADAARFTIDASTGVLSFVTAPDHEAPTDVGGDNLYDVVVRVSDGLNADSQSITVRVVNLNDNAPVITSNGGGASTVVSINENTTAVTTVTATDADAGSSLSYSISGGADAALFSIDASTGVLRFIAAPDFEAPQDAGGNNVYDVEVTVSDGSFTDVQAIAVTVNNVNDNAPVITSNGGGASAAVAIDENTTSVTTVTATDADGLGVLTYSITGGADAARFSIDAATGVLRFIVAPDREAPTDAGGNNVYDVEVTVSDGSLTDVQAIAVTVNNVNDNAPVITSNGGGANAAVSINENTTAVTTVTATDADAGSSLSYSISGGADAALFSIDASTGVLRFIAAPDFEAPQDAGGNNVYDVEVTVSDGSFTDVQAIAVTVNNVNDNAPVITSNGGGASAAVAIDENTTAVTTVTATDADGLGVLTYSITGGADAARFSIDASTGALRFNAAPDHEHPQDVGEDNVYDVVVSVSDGALSVSQAIAVAVGNVNDNTPVITSHDGALTVSLDVAEGTTDVTVIAASDADPGAVLTYSITGGADQARFVVDATTGVLRFVLAPDRELPADADGDNVYDVEVTVSDGNFSDVQAVSVTVTDINDNAPVIISDGGGAAASVNVDENTTAVTTVAATDADDGVTLVYSISGGADAALFSIDGNSGVLRFIAAPNFEAPQDADGDNVYDVEVTVSDGSFTDVQAIAVTVNNVNDNAPVITSNGGGASTVVSINENSTAVTTVTATDADAGSSLSYSISGGADAALFSIDAGTGVLRFIAAPDFEAPQDVGGNNVYDVEVTVSDGSFTDVQAIAVTVNNVNDNVPVITSNGGGATASLSVNENGTTVTIVTATDADAGTTLSYSLGGADAGRFDIDSSTGVITFNVAPDHEAPLDADGDNVYEVAVTVSDGVNSDVQAIRVMVVNVNDNAPVITSDGGGAAASVDVSENATAVTRITATDADGMGTLTYSISGGADAARFTIDALTGVLRFIAAPDFEVPLSAGNNNVYEVEVTASDGTLSSVQYISISVLNEDEQPVWTGTLPTLTTRVGQPLVLPASSGPLAMVRDPEGASLQIQMANGPSHGAVVIAPDGTITYTPVAGFVGMDQFAVRVSDGLLASEVQWVSVRVEAAVVAPVVTPQPPEPLAERPSLGPVQAVEPPAAPSLAANPDGDGDTSAPGAASQAGGASVPGLLDGDTNLADGAVANDSRVPAQVQSGAGVTMGVPRYSTEMWSWFGQAASVTGGAPLSPLEVLVQVMEQGAQVVASSAAADVVPAAFDLGDLGRWPPESGDVDVTVDVQAVQLGGVALSAGAVWWAARTSGLLASMAVSAPAWRGIDPLPVLGRSRQTDDMQTPEPEDALAHIAEAMFDLAPAVDGGFADIDGRR
jgi:type III secretion system FlhB-like substrate exporter